MPTIVLLLTPSNLKLCPGSRTLSALGRPTMALATALQSAHSWEEPARELALLAMGFVASVSISILPYS